MPTAATLTPAQAAEKIKDSNAEVVGRMNDFTRETFRTRGGRKGSGMGLLLEGLWGYHMSAVLEPFGIDIGWIADDQYNDYACIDKALPWDPITQSGELLRIEAKSMNLGADEQKGHFAELVANIHENDLLLVLVWRWADVDASGWRVWPKIVDVFIDRALPLAQFRDELHLARGGTFVDASDCPDGCDPGLCQHHGEPLNARGSRERLQGPLSRKPAGSSIGANFGGLKRMLGTRGQESITAKRSFMARNPEAQRFDEFMRAAARQP